jgi:hypothetical protein
VRIEVFGSNVIRVGVFSRLRVEDGVVAIRVPLVPIVVLRRLCDLVLRLVASTLNRDELALSNARAALLGCNLYFTFADEHFSMVVACN